MVGLAEEAAGGELDLAGVPPLPPLWMIGGARVSVHARSPPWFGLLLGRRGPSRVRPALWFCFYSFADLNVFL
jgi:hypothetical protein